MNKPKRVFLLGASGMGMAPLAFYLRGAGVEVEAFDDYFREPLRTQMQDAGIKVLMEPVPIQTPDCVIRSSAIGTTDSRLSSFRSKSIEIFKRGDFLAKYSNQFKTVAIVGSHGKTTSAGMLSWALSEIDFNFSYLVGGRFKNDFLPMGKFQDSPWMVLEVDESDGTIDGFAPDITVVLNCDWDHVDRYKHKGSVSDVFKNLLSRTRSGVILSHSSSLLPWVKKSKRLKVSTFELEDDSADYMASNRDASIACATMMGADVDQVNFKKFPGMERRQSTLFEDANRLILEDYAHHPTEIRAFLADRRKKFPDRWMKVVFQSHRYSRTKAFAESFAEELSVADELNFLPTYGAFENYDAEGDAEALSGYLPPRLRATTKIFADYPSFMKDKIGTEDKSISDQILFLGAGNIEGWAHAFAAIHHRKGDRVSAFSYFLKDRLSHKCVLRKDESLASKTTMRVGGTALWYAEPKHTEDLRSLVEASNYYSIPRVMLGRGSNLIIPDEGYDGLVLRLRGEFWKEISPRSDDSFIVGAGARLNDICKLACQQELVGFEFLEGIPGTLGGALRMNAGAMGWEIYDLVEWVSFLLPDGSIREIPGNQLNIGYRFCQEAKDGIALRAKLKAEGRSDHKAIRSAIEELAQKRRSSQPREASAGCIFKNPEEKSAGWLIENCGMKGERVGSAVVSSVHANFIVNEGGATAEDVISLMQKVRRRVNDETKITLEPEVGLLGKKWKDQLS
ncbi:UDP-N-acetylmuramate dehydrogenase [Opitutales bacterium]|nr:UDP-N-acetylmuramate dehydrogenase [Opitutales bacterium]